MNSLLIDTNVLIYSTNRDSNYFNDTNKFLKEQKFNLVTTSKNLTEYLAVFTRIPLKPLKISEALEIIDTFKNLFNILYPNKNSFLIFEELLLKHKPTGLKIHDFEIASIALVNDINSIYTYNKKNFSIIKEIELVKI